LNSILVAWNEADEAEALEAMLACCGAQRWAAAMIALRPLKSVRAVSKAADRVWDTMKEPDWMEAFACHPRIGERKVPQASAQSVMWSRQEQSQAIAANERLLARLAEGNALYEQRFGFTYVVCAADKSAGKLLAILERRISSTRDAELREAAEQQRQIMQLRLGKWLVA
jgi:2-oxo-4-hydroxy-4-carboxy-5-ureidoimidazoline decarboxylase